MSKRKVGRAFSSMQRSLDLGCCSSECQGFAIVSNCKLNPCVIEWKESAIYSVVHFLYGSEESEVVELISEAHWFTDYRSSIAVESL